MTDQGIDIQHPKMRGEWAELRFMARAAEHGLCVAKPWGDSSPYDVAVEHNGNFLRVQVKCTKYERHRSYECDIRSHGVPYSSAHLDFFALYVIEPDVWYIVPFAVIDGRSRVILSPHRSGSKYEPFREAWHLLRGEPSALQPPPGASLNDPDPIQSDSNEDDLEQSPEISDNPLARIKWNPVWRPFRMPRR